MKKIGAIILAAGYSSRMNAFKPLLEIKGKPALQGLMDEIASAGIGALTVVTGYRHEELQELIHNAGAVEAYNNNFDKGMFSSIQKGLETARKNFSGYDGFLLMPVDCPLICREMLELIMQNVREYEKKESFFVLTFRGKKGHPLYIPNKYIDEIIDYDGPGGLKGITDKYWAKMKKVPCGDEGCILDMDTPEGYREILAFCEAGRVRPQICELAKGRRIILVRHGETRLHQEKMFIGQYDVPLNEKGRTQAAAIGEAIRRAEADVPHIYTSPLCRAVETAEIIAGVAGISELKIIQGFKEINLGAWDGMPVREVKEKYPQQYAIRGEDIFAFKIGNKAENFYDVQYRAVNELRSILENDESKDIVIVSHSAVIRALQNNLEGRGVEENWNKVEKGEYIILER